MAFSNQAILKTKNLMSPSQETTIFVRYNSTMINENLPKEGAKL
jgi:hypothetical protein